MLQGMTDAYTLKIRIYKDGSQVKESSIDATETSTDELVVTYTMVKLHNNKEIYFNKKTI